MCFASIALFLSDLYFDFHFEFHLSTSLPPEAISLKTSYNELGRQYIKVLQLDAPFTR
jgi:hypothetical protein